MKRNKMRTIPTKAGNGSLKYHQLEKRERDKRSSLFGLFACDEESRSIKTLTEGDNLMKLFFSLSLTEAK